MLIASTEASSTWSVSENRRRNCHTLVPCNKQETTFKPNGFIIFNLFQTKCATRVVTFSSCSFAARILCRIRLVRLVTFCEERKTFSVLRQPFVASVFVCFKKNKQTKRSSPKGSVRVSLQTTARVKFSQRFAFLAASVNNRVWLVDGIKQSFGRPRHVVLVSLFCSQEAFCWAHFRCAISCCEIVKSCGPQRQTSTVVRVWK